jgi:hypothetical protein
MACDGASSSEEGWQKHWTARGGHTPGSLSLWSALVCRARYRHAAAGGADWSFGLSCQSAPSRSGCGR